MDPTINGHHQVYPSYANLVSTTGAQATELASPLPPPSPTPPVNFPSVLVPRRSSHFDVILGESQPSSTPFAGSTIGTSPPASYFPPAPVEVNGHVENANSPMSLSSLVGSGGASSLPVAPTNGFVDARVDAEVTSVFSNPFAPTSEAGPSRLRGSLPSSLATSADSPSPAQSQASTASSRKRQRGAAFGEETTPASPAGSIPGTDLPTSSKPPSARAKKASAKPRVTEAAKKKAAGSAQLASGSPLVGSVPGAPSPQQSDLNSEAALLLSLTTELVNPASSIALPPPALPFPSAANNPTTHSASTPLLVSASASISPSKEAAPLPPLPRGFDSELPPFHLPYIVPFPQPFNSEHTPFVPSLKSSLQTSLLPLMQPVERTIAFALEMLPMEFLKLKADLEAVMAAEGNEEDARGVVEGWKSGLIDGKKIKKGRMPALGRREEGRIVLEYLQEERKKKAEEKVQPVKKEQQISVPTGSEEATIEAMDVEEKVAPSVNVKEEDLRLVDAGRAVKPQQPQAEPMQEDLKVEVAEPLASPESKGKAKETGVDMAKVAFTVESTDPDKYAVWVFLQGYLIAGEKQQSDIRTVATPLPEADRNDVISILRSVKEPWPRPPRPSGRARKTPKPGPFALASKLSPVTPLPPVHDPFSASAYTLFGEDSSEETQLKMLKLQAQLAKAKEQQRARELKWMEKREPRKSLPVPVAVKAPKEPKEKKVPAAKRRKMEQDALAAASAEWRYEIEEHGKGADGRSITIQHINQKDASLSQVDVVTLASYNAMLAVIKGDLGKIVFETYQSLPAPPPGSSLFTPSDLTLFPTISHLFLIPTPHGSKNPSSLFRSSKDISPDEMEAFYPALFHAIERKWKEEGRIRDLLMMTLLYKTAQVKRSAMRKGGAYIQGRGVSTLGRARSLREAREGTGESGGSSAV